MQESIQWWPLIANVDAHMYHATNTHAHMDIYIHIYSQRITLIKDYILTNPFHGELHHKQTVEFNN